MKNNKKTITLTIFGVSFLLVLVIGATYAYFTVDASNEFKTTKIDATTPSIGNVTLRTGNNLYLNLTRNNMMSSNTGSYYGVTQENGEASTSAVNATIGTLNVTGEGKFSCNYELQVTNTGDLKEALTEAGVVTFAINNNYYDVYETNFPLTITGTINGITQQRSKNITAQLRFVNASKEQNELINKNMTLEFSAVSLNCETMDNSEVMASGIASEYLIDNISSNELWNSPLEGDGYRYVGETPNNYICFGTSDKDTCKTGNDKYMYRIIGIFEDESGQEHLKLIKSTALTERYRWHSDNYADVDWNESTLYSGINGEYFLTNEYYPYMQDTTWTDKIAEWNYTMTNTKSWVEHNATGIGVYYNDNTVKSIYLHELNRNSKSNETCYYNYGSDPADGDCDLGEWKTLKAKISLMYVSDYYLASGSVGINNAVLNNYKDFRDAWIESSNCRGFEKSGDEWTMTRFGTSSDSAYGAWSIDYDGQTNGSRIASQEDVVRPVFYLNSDVELSGGTGSYDDPYLIS